MHVDAVERVAKEGREPVDGLLCRFKIPSLLWPAWPVAASPVDLRVTGAIPEAAP